MRQFVKNTFMVRAKRQNKFIMEKKPPSFDFTYWMVCVDLITESHYSRSVVFRRKANHKIYNFLISRLWWAKSYKLLAGIHKSAAASSRVRAICSPGSFFFFVFLSLSRVRMVWWLMNILRTMLGDVRNSCSIILVDHMNTCNEGCCIINSLERSKWSISSI